MDLNTDINDYEKLVDSYLPQAMSTLKLNTVIETRYRVECIYNGILAEFEDYEDALNYLKDDARQRAEVMISELES